MRATPKTTPPRRIEHTQPRETENTPHEAPQHGQCEHDDQHDRDEPRRERHLRSGMQPLAHATAVAESEIDAGQQPDDAAQLHDDAAACAAVGGIEQRNARYDIESVHFSVL